MQARAQVGLARPALVVEQAVEQRVRVAAAARALALEQRAQVAEQHALVDAAARAERVDHAQRVVDERVVDEPLVGQRLGEDRLARLAEPGDHLAHVRVRGLAVEVALAVAHDAALGPAAVELEQRVLLVRLEAQPEVEVQPHERDDDDVAGSARTTRAPRRPRRARAASARRSPRAGCGRRTGGPGRAR